RIVGKLGGDEIARYAVCAGLEPEGYALYLRLLTLDLPEASIGGKVLGIVNGRCLGHPFLCLLSLLFLLLLLLLLFLLCLLVEFRIDIIILTNNVISVCVVGISLSVLWLVKLTTNAPF